MWALIREVFTFACFLSLLYAVIYSNVNTNAFYHVRHLRKFLLHSDNIHEDYTKVSNGNVLVCCFVSLKVRSAIDFDDQWLLVLVGEEFRAEDSRSAMVQRRSTSQPERIHR